MVRRCEKRFHEISCYILPSDKKLRSGLLASLLGARTLRTGLLAVLLGTRSHLWTLWLELREDAKHREELPDVPGAGVFNCTGWTVAQDGPGTASIRWSTWGGFRSHSTWERWGNP